MSSEERRQKEKENRKNTILKAARKLFLDKGFKSVTVDNIAAKASLSKGSIYLYFDSKEEIYTQILIADTIEFHKSISDFSVKQESASSLLLNFGELYVNYFLSDQELFRILMDFMLRAEQMNLTNEQRNQLIAMTNDNIQIVAQILQKGVESGEFRENIDVRQGQNAIWGLLNGVIALYLFTGTQTKRAEKIHATVKDGLNIFIDGLKKIEK